MYCEIFSYDPVLVFSVQQHSPLLYGMKSYDFGLQLPQMNSFTACGDGSRIIRYSTS